MTPHRLTNWLAAAALAGAIATVLSTSHLLDSAGTTTADHRAEWAESTALADAQAQAQRAARLERAAAHVCTEANGHGAAYRWSEAGDLICTARRGGRVAVVVGSAL